MGRPVTSVTTVQGWLYLACVTDVFSRLVIGWSMASHRKTDLVVDAVTMAVHRRGGHVPGVIHHSDRGREYSSHALERELRRHRALASMGSVADCFDNALAESEARQLRDVMRANVAVGRPVNRQHRPCWLCRRHRPEPVVWPPLCEQSQGGSVRGVMGREPGQKVPLPCGCRDFSSLDRGWAIQDLNL